MKETFVLDALRTPFGRHGGGLAGVRPDDLAAAALRELLARNSTVDPAEVDDVVLGDANGAGEDNRNVARMAVLLADLPTSVPGTTVNRLCGSGMDAVVFGARAIVGGDARIVVAGGVESMTRAPWVVPKPAVSHTREHATMHSTTLGWRLVNPSMPDRWTIALGASAELLAERYAVSREEQDEFAVRSHRRADASWSAGSFEREVFAFAGLDRDEGVRALTSAQRLAQLRPAFMDGGTVTAGNASPLSDGAAMVLLGDGAAAARMPGGPLARIAARAVAAVDPDVFGIAPVPAVEQALGRAGIGWEDLDIVEVNEAFAAQVLACMRHWPRLDPDILNAQGGAIAIGHPLGASGARLIGTVAHQLRASGRRWGLATICVGVGQALAVVLERA